MSKGLNSVELELHKAVKYGKPDFKFHNKADLDDLHELRKHTVFPFYFVINENGAVQLFLTPPDLTVVKFEKRIEYLECTRYSETTRVLIKAYTDNYKHGYDYVRFTAFSNLQQSLDYLFLDEATNTVLKSEIYNYTEGY